MLNHMDTPKKFVNIKEAATMLGVTALTLRNWDKSGKLVPLRHPLNNYRAYRVEDIERLLNIIGSNTTARPKLPPKNKKRKLEVKHIDESDSTRDSA